MGVIRVKLANNYKTDPAVAATAYFLGQREVKIIAPDNIIPGTWQLSNTLPYHIGFGAIAKTTDSTEPYWGFSVCFLYNQMTGYTDLYNKHLLQQEAAGDISTNYQKWWEAGNELAKINFDANVNAGSLQEMATFLHPAQIAIDRLNEISNQDVMDIDFTYPSPIHQDQPNFYLNDTDASIPLRKRTMQTSQRVLGKQVPGTDPKQNEGFGAYGDNPWPKCSMMTFYNTQAFRGATIDQVQADMKENVTECGEKQENDWNNQWDDIDGGPAAEASAKSAGAPSIPSDAFSIDESGDLSKYWPAYIKVQEDNRPEADQIRKDLNDGLELDGIASILDHYNADEDENERYAVIGSTVLNEPQALKAAKIIKEVFDSAA